MRTKSSSNENNLKAEPAHGYKPLQTTLAKRYDVDPALAKHHVLKRDSICDGCPTSNLHWISIGSLGHLLSFLPDAQSVMASLVWWTSPVHCCGFVYDCGRGCRRAVLLYITIPCLPFVRGVVNRQEADEGDQKVISAAHSMMGPLCPDQKRQDVGLVLGRCR